MAAVLCVCVFLASSRENRALHTVHQAPLKSCRRSMCQLFLSTFDAYIDTNRNSLFYLASRGDGGSGVIWFVHCSVFACRVFSFFFLASKSKK